MKKQFYTALVVLFTGIVVLLSCQKEISCEGCQENNKPPTAVAGPDQAITLPTDSVLLDGSSSGDPDGTINNWLWTKIAGPASFAVIKPTDSTTAVKNLAKGVYLFELKITDNGGLFAKDTMQLIVNDPSQPNHPPIANAGADQTITLPTNTIDLDGSASTDPENNISNYTWTKISGASSFNITNANTVQTQVTNLAQGVYQFELKVTDAGGLFSKDTIQITVNDPSQSNRPPVANAGADQSITLPTNTVTINGSASNDPDNNITNYTWTKITGPSSFNITNANAIQTQVTNLVQGVYQFELKVTDAGGLFDKDTTQVTVRNPCTNCKLVFVSDRDGNNEIYSCNADGSNVTRLTNNAGHDLDPVWSPDGTRIAFFRYVDINGPGGLYIMNADGSNVVQRTFTGGGQNPAWSPDGTRIAFLKAPYLMVLDLASGSVSQLPDTYGGSSVDPDPAWSPDGTKIAFDSDWRAWDFMSDIFTISPDGSGRTLLTPIFSGDHDYWRPSWSPDGTMLSFTIRDNMAGADHGSIGVMRPDGTGPIIIRTGILMGNFRTTRTSWSVDGTRIAYTENKTIKWVAADGSAAATIIANGWDADWSH